MEFLSVSMAVGFLLPMGKNEDLRFVQTVLHTVTFDDCPEIFTPSSTWVIWQGN
jgi:hypothetical protein